MSVTQVLTSISDAAILADLQALGTSASVTDYHTVAGVPTVTWASAPTPADQNDVTAYFQQNSQLRQWT